MRCDPCKPLSGRHGDPDDGLCYEGSGQVQ